MNNSDKFQSVADLKKQLNDFFNYENIEITPMSGGASVRQYFHLYFKEAQYFPSNEIILMTIPGERIEIADDYLDVSYYLRRMNIPRPRLYEMHRERGWIFLKPASGERLDLYLHQNCNSSIKVYRQLIDFLIELQKNATFEKHCPAFQRFFDKEKYLYEFNFHVKQELLEKYFKQEITGRQALAFENFSHEISQFLHSTTAVFVHRDFQSSNIFYDENNSRQPFEIIDFQDARSGSYVYDLVSLLWDSYVNISEAQRTELTSNFIRQNPLLKNSAEIDEIGKWIDYSVIQRKLHDAGAFAYNFHLTGNDHFLKFIDSSIQMAVDKIRRYTNFNEIEELFVK